MLNYPLCFVASTLGASHKKRKNQPPQGVLACGRTLLAYEKPPKR